MMRCYAPALLCAMIVTSGCAAAALTNPAGISSVASAIEAVSSTATGFKATKSAAELNGANKGLVEAQTAMTEVQVTQTQTDRARVAQERVVTARLLRDMSNDYQERVFMVLAEWVEAGGDPDFAFRYALARIDDDSRTKILPQQNYSPPGLPAQTSAIAPSSLQLKAPDTRSVPTTSGADPVDAGATLFPYPEGLFH